MKVFNFNWRVGSQIRAPKVRVIGTDGKQLGVLPIEKALSEAANVGLSLVEIAPNAKPPVAKIVELGKFKYQEEKKLQKQKRGSKVLEVKEIRFSPFIGKADYDIRIERIKEFLADKDKVKVVVKFMGRQMGSKQFGYDLLKKVLSEFEDEIALDMEPKFMGRHLMMVISPLTKVNRQEVKVKVNTNTYA